MGHSFLIKCEGKPRTSPSKSLSYGGYIIPLQTLQEGEIPFTHKTMKIISH